MEICGDLNGIGGGQILRTALAMSLLTEMPFTIKNIRKNRPNPGLKKQHVSALKIIEELYDVQISEYKIGSTELSFMPKSKKLKAKRVTYDIGTAGSITLLSQSILLPLIFSDAKQIVLKIKGGTDVSYSMPFDFLSQIFLPQIKFLANDIKIDLGKRGFFPIGNGEISIRIKPKFMNKEEDFRIFQEEMLGQNLAFNLVEKGFIQNIIGFSTASKQLNERRVAERQERSARLILKGYANTNIRVEYTESDSVGSVIALYAKYSPDNYEIDFKNPVLLGSDALGKKDKRAEDVGKEAAQKLVELIKGDACVDEHIADNLIPYLAIVGGKIKTNTITDHIIANAYVVNEFLKSLKSEYYININRDLNIISLDKSPFI